MHAKRVVQSSHLHTRLSSKPDKAQREREILHRRNISAVLAPVNNRKKEIRANQAGTKGWRAPEVLMQYVHQTTAIDVWSAGVMMLSVLSRKYPMFEGMDNNTNLLEICRYVRH